MSSHSQRDREADLDRLLASAMPGMLTDASAECVDAETLAAWSEGSLASDVAHEVEAHLSTCGRCQAVLAAFAQVEPAAPAAVSPWRRGSIRWLVPLAAAAAAAIAVGLHFRAAAPPTAGTAPAITVAQAELPQAPVPAPTQEAAAGALLPKAAEPSGAGGRGPITTNSPVATPTRMPRAKQGAMVGSAADRRQATSDLPTLPTEPARPPSPAAPQVAGGAVQDQAAASANLGAPAGAAGAGSLALAGRGGAGGAGGRGGAVSVTVEVVASDDIPMFQAASGERSNAVNRSATAGALQSAPLPVRSRWRVRASGIVERSTDNGQSWTRVDTEPPGAITAGSAPANNVCWFVGHGGMVIVFTVDGTVFTSPAFPEPTDLVSVQASDARNATVITSDNRRFQTADGGGTWRLIN